MARILIEKFKIPQEIEVLLDVYPANHFDESFGIWPDNMVAFDGRKLIFRGIINLDGGRDNHHSKELEIFMNSY